MNRKVSAIAAEMADRDAIRDVLYRYCRGIDRLDAELILSTYWPDAVDEHGSVSAKSAKDFVDHAVLSLQKIDQTKHCLTNILIDIAGSTAHVESYILAFHRLSRPDGTQFDNLSSIRFIDRMERRDDEWRVKKRVVLRDFFHEFMDAVADWKDGHMPKILGHSKDAPLQFGSRKPHDPSYELLRRLE